MKGIPDKLFPRELMKTVRQRGLLFVLLLAIMVEAIGLLQYHYSRKELLKDVGHNSRLEIDKIALEIASVTGEIESTARNVTWFIQNSLASPDSVAACLERVLANNPSIIYAELGFVPDYYRSKGYWFEPVAVRDSAGGIGIEQIGGKDHDYLQAEWYTGGLKEEEGWSKPYFDESIADEWLITHTTIIRDSRGGIAGVLGLDLPLVFLDELTGRPKTYPGSSLCITSDVGDILSGVALPENDDDLITYEQVLDKTGWTVSMAIPEDSVYQGIRRAMTGIILLQALSLIFLILLLQKLFGEYRKFSIVEARKDRMERELEIAYGIQMSMVPKSFPPYPQRTDIDLYATIVPAKDVSGDLYDFFIRDEKLIFCIGDVSGKGVPASIVMAVTRSLFRTASNQETSPGKIVGTMNRSMSEMNESSMFVTFFCGMLNLATGELRYCNAGHNAPVLLNGSKEMLPVVPNLPIGIDPDMRYKEQRTYMHYDDALFLYTDGLTEAENKDHEMFGEERMLSALSGRLDAEERTLTVKKAVDAFVDDAPRSDDLTTLFIHYLKPEPEPRNTHRITLENDLGQIPRLQAFIGEIASESGMTADICHQVNLALEEAVTNVMMYAYPEREKGLIEVSGTTQESCLTLVISDSGIPFDPTAVELPDITLPEEERQIGGLGIYLIRTIMDTVSYERSDGNNILTMTKKY